MNHQMRLWVLAIFSVGTKLDAVIMSPVSQPVEHHELVNQRIYCGILNFFDVVSSVSLLLAGVVGYLFLT